MTINQAVTENLSLKQRLSITEALEPNNQGQQPKVSVWDGSVRSGKTIASLLAFLIYITNAPRGGELVIVGRTRESIGRNVFGPLTDPTLFGPMAQHISYTPGAPTAKIFGRRVHVLGSSNIESEKVLRGLTVAGAYVDEATLVAEPFWVQLLARLSIRNSQLFATTNPDGPTHWFNKTVIKRIDELGYKRFHFLLRDNDYLLRENPDYIRQLELEYTGLWKRRFIDGEWVQAEGAIYDMWDEETHTVQPNQIPEIERIYMVGLDFGTNHPTRAYAVGIGKHWEDDRDVLYTLDEFRPETHLTTGIQSQQFQEWLTQLESDWGMAPDWVAVDPAAAHFRAQLFEDGIHNVMGAHNKVEAGILTISALLATHQLYVSTKCEQLIDHIPGYMWDPKATDRGTTAPVKEDDDEVDAWRYAVYTSRRFWRGRIRVTPATEDTPDTDIEEY